MSNLEKQIAFWKKSAEENWDVAEVLFESKKYSACLFFCHLTLEKILKGIIVKRMKKPAPYIHDLAQLASDGKITISDEQRKSLRIITGFNISGRYSDAKLDFHKICTREYAKKYLDISKESAAEWAAMVRELV